MSVGGEEFNILGLARNQSQSLGQVECGSGVTAIDCERCRLGGADRGEVDYRFGGNQRAKSDRKGTHQKPVRLTRTTRRFEPAHLRLVAVRRSTCASALSEPDPVRNRPSFRLSKGSQSSKPETQHSHVALSGLFCHIRSSSSCISQRPSLTSWRCFT